MPYVDHTPKYRHHKVRNLAVVTIDGRDIYLGVYNSPESREAYDRHMAEWFANGRTLAVAPAAGGMTVTELMAAFWVHVENTYRRPDGTATTEVDAFRHALRPLKKLYASTPAAEFGPLKLKAVRHEMITRGWTRKNINRQIGRIKHLFKWAASDELIPPSVTHGLAAVGGLRKGSAGVQESTPVKPVPEELLEAVLARASRHIRAMVEYQLLTGSRPDEVCSLRMADLDMTGKVWTYRPPEHKTAHHEHNREIKIGPKAQDVIRPFLKTQTTAYLFDPREAEAERNAERRAARKTPMTPSQAARKAKHTPKRPKRDHFDVDSYRRAIARACHDAFPPPVPLAQRDEETTDDWKKRLTPEQHEELRAWHSAHHWHPHQLRHSAATRLREQFGIEAARVVLGVKSAAITEVYAERDQKAAARIMAEVG
jgi:integrase